jgi:hypothetical protein
MVELRRQTDLFAETIQYLLGKKSPVRDLESYRNPLDGIVGPVYLRESTLP